MKIIITMTLDPGYADPDHSMGITEAGYDTLTDFLGQMGTDIDVKKDEAP